MLLFDGSMRTVLLLSILALSRGVHAAPCVAVAAPTTEDAAAVRAAVLAAIPAAPRACLDVSVAPIERVDSAAEITLAATVRVMISDERGRMTLLVSGGATVHVRRAQFRDRKLAGYRRDALDEAVGGIVPAVLTHLAPSAAQPRS